MNLTIQNFKNHSKELVDQFLSGDTNMCRNRYDVALCTKVLNSIDQTDDSDYMQVVDNVKGFLTRTERTIYNNVCIIHSDAKMTPKEKAVVIRLINMAHRGKELFIVTNDKLIHMPPSYEKLNIEDVIMYVNSQLRDYRQKKDVKLFRFSFIKFLWFYGTNHYPQVVTH